mmetsp:Transcript_24030/g.55840  ORF Transcript_24030/g.55840 Transcript_24030/m.55840 type:complete len:224 (+) Transcript_24030:806-1477(+)
MPSMSKRFHPPPLCGEQDSNNFCILRARSSRSCSSGAFMSSDGVIPAVVCSMVCASSTNDFALSKSNILAASTAFRIRESRFSINPCLTSALTDRTTGASTLAWSSGCSVGASMPGLEASLKVEPALPAVVSCEASPGKSPSGCRRLWDGGTASPWTIVTLLLSGSGGRAFSIASSSSGRLSWPMHGGGPLQTHLFPISGPTGAHPAPAALCTALWQGLATLT